MKAKVVSITAVKKPTPRLVCMTGTPVSESPLNAYSLVRLVNPSLATSKIKFNSAFTNTVEKFYGGQKKVELDKKTPYKNLDKLRTIMSGFSIRRTLAEVHGMPKKIWMTREVTLSPEQKKVYNTVAAKEKLGLSFSSLGEKDMGSVSLRLRQVLLDPTILGFDAPSAKFDALEDLASEILEDPQAKMVVWLSFVTSMPALLKRFKQYHPVALYEQTTQAEIVHLNKTFDHSSCRLVFASPAKASTGVDFLARARYAVYLDRPFSSTQWLQSQDRLVRRVNLASTDEIELLKGSPATLIDLYAPGTVDALTHALLDRKIDLIEGSDASIGKLAMSRDEFLSFIKEIE